MKTKFSKIIFEKYNNNQYTEIHYFFQELKHNNEEISQIICICEELIKKVSYSQLSKLIYIKYQKDMYFVT